MAPEHLLLVLDVGEPAAMSKASALLSSLNQKPFPTHLGVVLLGNAQCDNSWLLPHMAQNGGKVKFAFLVYDSPNIDNNVFYQWPLGVDT